MGRWRRAASRGKVKDLGGKGLASAEEVKEMKSWGKDVECGLSPEVINAKLCAFTVALRKRPREAEGGSGKQIQGAPRAETAASPPGAPRFFLGSPS